jgi:hypothetical protein
MLGAVGVTGDNFEGSTGLVGTGLVGLLRRLYPRRGRRNRGTRPLLCLIRREDQPSALPALRRLFGGGLVVHVELSTAALPTEATFDTEVTEVTEVTAADHPPPEHGRRPPITEHDVRLVSTLLRELTNRLGRVDDRRRRIGRFRRFAVTVWLMNHELGESAGDQESRDRRVRELMRDQGRYQQRQNLSELQVPGWLGALVIVLPFVWFRARVSGRLPVLSGHYRWFVRRESLAPPVSGGMTDVAAALTDGEWQRDPDTALLFLVNSFMQDVRAAFRSSRYTACATLLLGGITRRNGGYQLLRAINDVRNQTELADPLLIVTESLRVPPFADPPCDLAPVSQAEAAYERWRAGHEHEQGLREAPAWYLPLALPPDQAGSDQAVSDETSDETAPRPAPLLPPREPRLRRVLPAAASVLLIAGAGYGYQHWSRQHCGNGLSWPGVHPTVWMTGGECVGITDTSAASGVFPDLAPQLDVIAEQNSEAADQHDAQPGRPLLTLVYVGVLTEPNRDSDSLSAEREGLKGVAVAQRWQLDAHGATDPLVRILVANGGQRMSSGPAVADTVVRMARTDPSIVGVIGLSRSYQATLDAVGRLAVAGIPSIGATLSTDVLADSSPLYYQIAPQNKREAAVVAAYVRDLQQTGALAPGVPLRTYYSADPADRYSNNLNADITASFARLGFRTESVPFGSPGQSNDAAAAGRGACGYPGVVFYAGRPQPDFGSFLNSIRNCGAQPLPARIIADDDTTRYVADENARRRYGSIPFDYVAFAATPPLAAGTERDFYTEYNVLFGADSPGASLDGHAALSFDSVLTFVYAVGYLRVDDQPIPMTPAAVWRQISSISGRTGFAGASGYIDFGSDVNRHVPIDKPVLVLKVRNGSVLNDASGYCGVHGDPRTQPWCPTDRP